MSAYRGDTRRLAGDTARPVARRQRSWRGVRLATFSGMTRVVVLLAMLSGSAAARPVAKTSSSAIVDGLRLELAVWDAAYGRGPIKAKLTLSNRSAQPITIDHGRASFTLVATWQEPRSRSTSTHGAPDRNLCGTATRTLQLAGPATTLRLAPGAAKTIEVDLSAAARAKVNGATPLVRRKSQLVATYQAVDAGRWTGMLETAPVSFTPPGSPRSPCP